MKIRPKERTLNVWHKSWTAPASVVAGCNISIISATYNNHSLWLPKVTKEREPTKLVRSRSQIQSASCGTGKRWMLSFGGQLVSRHSGCGQSGAWKRSTPNLLTRATPTPKTINHHQVRAQVEKEKEKETENQYEFMSLALRLIDRPIDWT